MKSIPEWQYPLYKKSDKIAYDALSLHKSYKIVGSADGINEFLRLLIASQKMRDYRKFRDMIVVDIAKNALDVEHLNKKAKTLEIKSGVESWAIFKQDERICLLIDSFVASKIKFSGSRRDIYEFISRFLLSQMLQDWRGPLMAVLMQCSTHKSVDTKKLNKLLSLWDYTHVFP